MGGMERGSWRKKERGRIKVCERELESGRVSVDVGVCVGGMEEMGV